MASQQSSVSSKSSPSCISISNGSIAKQNARKSYACTFCDKSFSTAMALGGHQNAHRGLRALAKRPLRTIYPNPYQRYPTNYATYPISVPLLTTDQRIAQERQLMMAINNKQSYGVQDAPPPPPPPPAFDHIRYLQEVFETERKAQRAMISASPAAATSTTLFGVRDFFGAANSALKTAPAGIGASTGAATSTTFFGVKDFFGASSALKTAPSIGAGGAAKSTTFFGVPDFFGASSALKTAPNIGASGTANVVVKLEDAEEEEKEELDLELKL